jgi:2-(1,2-epoxy-1,2-dihydrophenyl)acetyl-CoA isomerase
MALVTVEMVERIAILRLNDPATLNALSIPMVEELRAALEMSEREARAVVVTGEGRAFCSGASLTGGLFNMSEGEFDAGAALQSHYNPLMFALRRLSVPFVTAVHGAAAGVGCSVALAGDLIVADATAYFLQAFQQLGLVPDGGSPFLLAASAGRARAMEAMLLGERIRAETAFAWGMINRLAPEGRDLAVAMELAGRLAQGPRPALALTRQIGWAAVENSFADQLALERVAQRTAGRTNEFVEGVTAFREKRKPRFGEIPAQGKIESIFD